MKIRGASVLVTGASAGIGEATAVHAARSGARAVVLVARTREKLERVAAEVRAIGAEAHVLACDVGDPEAVQAMAEAAPEVDIVINNAGMGRWVALEDTTPEELAAMTAVPYTAGFLVSRAFLPGMLARRRGHLAFVNSPACMVGIPGAAGYGAARWAVRGLAEVLRSDLKGTGVGVTHFIVGKVSSTYFENNPDSEGRIPAISSMIPTLTPQETARRLLGAVDRNRGQLVTPLQLWGFYVLNQWSPWLVRSLIQSTGWKRDPA